MNHAGIEQPGGGPRPFRADLYYTPGSGQATLRARIDGQTIDIEIPGRCARLLKALVIARKRDDGYRAAHPGWRRRERLKFARGGGEESTISQYGKLTIERVRDGLARAHGVAPDWSVIERRRGVGFRLSAAVSNDLHEDDGGDDDPLLDGLFS